MPTSNSAFHFKHRQECFFFLNSHQRVLGWLGSTSVDTPRSLGIVQGRGMATPPAGRKAGRPFSSLQLLPWSWTAAVPEGAGDSLPCRALSKIQTSIDRIACVLCLTRASSCLNCDCSVMFILGGGTFGVLVG